MFRDYLRINDKNYIIQSKLTVSSETDATDNDIKFELYTHFTLAVCTCKVAISITISLISPIKQSQTAREQKMHECKGLWFAVKATGRLRCKKTKRSNCTRTTVIIPDRRGKKSLQSLTLPVP